MRLSSLLVAVLVSSGEALAPPQAVARKEKIFAVERKPLRSGAVVVCGLVVAAASAATTTATTNAMTLGGALETTTTTTTSTTMVMWPRIVGWAVLFGIASFVHAAEIAITTLWPWKVREFAEEEGKRSPFAKISGNLTPVMTAMLVASTACSVCGTSLATSAIGALAPGRLAIAGACLAAVTIFFGELLPKTLGVYCAEPIARRAIPWLVSLAYVLAPVGAVFSLGIKALITPLGWKFDDESTAASVVSEAELRLLVAAAGQSGSIGRRESSMVASVLDLQDTKVSEVMTPRVEVVAIDETATVDKALDLMTTTKFSRLPVFSSDVDNITGVVLAKSLIKTYEPKEEEATVVLKPAFLSKREDAVRVGDLALDSTYFIPESMSVWAALEAMRRRRCHMAVVVDEYGGTAGIVTLEDILEEIVGEIYDEEDALDGSDLEDQSLIKIVGDSPDSRAYAIRGEAELDDVRAALFGNADALIYADDDANDQDAADSSNSEDSGKRKPLDGELHDCVTLSGLLCAVKGEIPNVGDIITDSGIIFRVDETDDRRVLQVLAWREDRDPFHHHRHKVASDDG
ncbi:hypothetical protein CTAYLR_000972 [Chrysophaeum taylorii]|uniref:Hemolysin n=1 Tax=Chrysophaeum taylorii TaxID=2483200 RepID=A0AAD7UH33_9STRA|nr:hypothetical protein CTAYLR_000972 [Chrysophaeum taylorii]